MATKIMAKQRAYFNGEIIKPGQIIEFNGSKVPSWAKEIKTENKTKQTKIQQKLLTLADKTEEELNEILDELITKALEVNVYIDNTENKTVIEQIQELDEAIKKKNDENKGK